jgi:hypothetical protein
MPDKTADKPDELVPDAQVRIELGNISAMQMWRYDNQPELIDPTWPPPVRFGVKKFRSRKQLEAFKTAMTQKAMAIRKTKLTKVKP